MKQFLLITLLIALSLSASAKVLKVYSVSGNVSKKEGTSWSKLVKPAMLSDRETIKINPASSLRLLDPATRQIYTFSSQGTHALSDLIKRAVKDNSSLGSKIAAESRRQAELAASKSHNAVAAAKRATLDEEQLEALYAALVNGFNANVNIGDLHMSKVQVEDNLVYLTITNSGDTYLYVNVFTQDEDGHWTAVYEFDNENPALLIAPGSTIELDHMLLADDEATFVAIGFPEAFDGTELSDMFSEEFAPGEKEAENVSLYFVK